MRNGKKWRGTWGGPYWVTTQNNVVTLQIVESSQVDLNDDNQVKLMARATHFNPVDLVCGIKIQKFNLEDLWILIAVSL
jgi:hypothetical protein